MRIYRATGFRNRQPKPVRTLAALALLATFLFGVPAASADTPTCTSTSSDSDGDGWGWENNQSCKVPTTTTGTPFCLQFDSDSDGDGWGWENNTSCRSLVPLVAVAKGLNVYDPSVVPDNIGTRQQIQEQFEADMMNMIEQNNADIDSILSRLVYVEEQLALGAEIRANEFVFPDADGDGTPDDQEDNETTTTTVPTPIDPSEFVFQDSDGDGVPDDQDYYPNENWRHDVNDRDGDGVLNADDDFPDDPSQSEEDDDPVTVTPTHNVQKPGVCCSNNKQDATHDANGRAYCESDSSDPDGDGWGWENNDSCVVRNS